jgi:ribosome-associated protein
MSGKSVYPPDSELIFEYLHSSGPGGQNVNKVSTAVQLRFDIKGSKSLIEYSQKRLFLLFGKKINQQGELVILAKRYRSQEQNKKDAIQRLHKMIDQARKTYPKRVQTSPTHSSKIARIITKNIHGLKKKERTTDWRVDS